MNEWRRNLPVSCPAVVWFAPAEAFWCRIKFSPTKNLSPPCDAASFQSQTTFSNLVDGRSENTSQCYVYMFL